mgnify:CR=1 FL=1
MNTTSASNAFWYLEDFNVVNLFCPRKVAANHDKLKDKTYKKGEYIYLVNEPSDTIYVVKSGKIKIGSYSEGGKEIIKIILSEGEIFGELALAGENRRNDYAVAIEQDTTICPMDIEDMKNLMLDNKDFSLHIFKLVGLRMRKMERRIESLVAKDARTRIVEYLKDSAEENGRKVGTETLIENTLTHQDIASLTGTSRQTVTTVLNELKENNLIYFDRKRILIRNLDTFQ